MMEKYSARKEIRYVKDGLISAITAVNLKIDGTNPKKQKEYEIPGKEILNHLADKDSLIYTIAPRIYEENIELIEKARESFPEPNSLDLLLTLLKIYSRL